MQIYSIQSYSGKNIYSHKPVIKMILDIENLQETTSKDIHGFNDRLVGLFPGLSTHYCSLGYEGGFVERLKEGTYFGHIIEHVILEMQSSIGYKAFYGKTRIYKEPSTYYIVFEYENEQCGIECAKAAVDIVQKLIQGEYVDINTIMENIKKAAIEYELGPSTKAIFDEAKKRGIPVIRLGNESLLQLGYGKYSRLIEASLSDATSCITADIVGNKHLTKQILSENNIPVPFGRIVYTEDAAVMQAKEIGYPVAVKPFDGNQGKGVAVNLNDESDVRDAYREALKFSKAAIVEKFIKGKDYRVLVVGDKVSAVAERRPPVIVGDGVHTVGELVQIENSDKSRGEDHEKPLTKIKIDSIAKQVLARKGINEYYVPSEGEEVILRDNGNLSTGGTARDCTEEIHPYNREIAIKAAKAVGLDIAGIDMTMEDIARPINENNGAVIEINAAPGLRMHIYPTEGKTRNVAGDIVDMMFPEGKPCSIPIAAVTGTNGKTTTTRLIKHTLSLTGKTVGMTSTSGVYVGDECIAKGDNTGPISARMVLSHKEVEAAVLETARGGIVKRGLGYDYADVGVIVNISDDHLGLDGLNSLEDLAFVKALVVEAVKPQGYAVINADDEMAEFLLGRVKSKVILFSKDRFNPLILKHVISGGRSVYVEYGAIKLFDGLEEIHLIELKEIPITFDGTAECNIENSLAAAAALFGLETKPEIIRQGLSTFYPDIKTNPGRFNCFDLGDFKVMLDYSHNPAGYNAVVKAVQRLGANRLVGVIGVPGDRLDRNIREVGEICGKSFNKIYIKEDRDLRGRKPGEVAALLFEGAIAGGAKSENVQVIHSEIKALESAILDAQPGDFVILFYEELEAALDLVDKFKKELEQTVIKSEALVVAPTEV